MSLVSPSYSYPLQEARERAGKLLRSVLMHGVATAVEQNQLKPPLHLCDRQRRVEPLPPRQHKHLRCDSKGDGDGDVC